MVAVKTSEDGENVVESRVEDPKDENGEMTLALVVVAAGAFEKIVSGLEATEVVISNGNEAVSPESKQHKEVVTLFS